MTDWTPAQLQALTQAEEIQIAPRRRDGTLIPARTIWVVTAPDSATAPDTRSASGRVFIRSTNGPTAAWYRSARGTGLGRVSTADGDIDVSFAPVPEQELGLVDAAYQAKYGPRYRSIVEHLLSDGPRPATLEVRPAT